MSIALSLIAGLVLLIAGGELLVRGAVRVAERLGLSPLIIGLTLVGFGTSTPELVTSVEAAMIGSPGIAVGNIVGSNIANILLILGIAALLSPIAVPPAALRRDGMIVVVTAVVFSAIGFFLTLNQVVGTLLVASLVGYITYAYFQERNTPGPDAGHTAAYERAEAYEEVVTHREVAGSKAKSILLWLGVAIAGLVLVVFGGRLLVDGAVSLARGFGISETVIGLTIVAVGTSLPELVTSVMAALRKHSDVALGNVLGSNIYNLLGIGGVTALIAPTAVPPEMLGFDLPVMIGASLLLIVFAATGRGINRAEGGVLLGAYVLYLFLLWPA